MITEWKLDTTTLQVSSGGFCVGGQVILDEAVVTKGDFTLNMNIEGMPETFFFSQKRITNEN